MPYIDSEALKKKIFPYGMPDNGNYGLNAKSVMVAIEKALAVDAVKYTFQDYAKHLVDLPPMVGVEATVREFSTRFDKEVQKAYIEGCISVDVDPDALVKTGELNRELQSALKIAVDKMPKWIPTSERLPDKELEEYLKKYPIMDAVEVIGKIKGCEEATVLYYDGELFLDYFDVAYIVSHWMPLPEAPEETKSAEVQDAE